VGLVGAWSLDLASSVSSGLVQSPGTLVSEITPSCPSGSCIWEPFESLGLCARVADITKHIRVTPVPFSTAANWTAWSSTVDENPLRLNGTLAYKVSFPTEGGESFVAPVSYTMYSSPLRGSSSIAFPNDTDLAAARVASYKIAWSTAGNATYLQANSSTLHPWTWRAAEVIYYACVNSYSINVTDGLPYTSSTPSHRVIASPAQGNLTSRLNCTTPRLVSGAAQLTKCTWKTANNFANQTMTLRGVSGGTFSADLSSLTLIGKFLTQDSTGIWAWDGVKNTCVAGVSGVTGLASAVYGYVTDGDPAKDGTGNRKGLGRELSSPGDVATQFARLDNMTRNVAVSITNGMRLLARDGDVENAFPVNGTMLGMQVFVQVRWPWLALLVGEVALAFTLFAWTLWETRRRGAPVFKSSALATLLAFDEPRGERDAGWMKREAVGRTATLGGRGVVGSPALVTGLGRAM